MTPRRPRCERCGNPLARIRDERLICLQVACPNPTRIDLQPALTDPTDQQTEKP